MKGVWKLLIVFIVLTAALTTFAAAPAAPQQSTTVAPPAATTTTSSGKSIEDSRDWFHHPTDWLTMGADERFRWEYGWNIDDLKSDAKHRDTKWNFLRQRLRWWTKTKINDDMDFNMRLAWEFREWDTPNRKLGSGSSLEKRIHEQDLSEIIFDQLNLTVRNLGGAPLTMVFGRQDIFLGDGWLVCDAGPLDGSRSTYFDALRFTYKIADQQTLDAILIANRAAEDAYIAPINNRHRLNTQQDELGAILYYTDKTRPNLSFDAYFMFKGDNPVNHLNNLIGSAGYDGFPPWWTRKAQIYTFGGALYGAINGSEHWKYRMEGAVQTGRQQGLVPLGTNNTYSVTHSMKNIMAFGTINKIEYNFNDEKKNKLRLMAEYMSGDDPGDGKIQQFNTLWGQWPRFSELLAYAYNLETRVGDITNLYRLGFGHSIQLTEKLSMDTDYNLLWADENTFKNQTHSSGFGFSGRGKFRGQLVTWMLKYQITKNLKAHILLEDYLPGN